MTLTDRAYCEGLLDAQRLANAYCHRLFAEGKKEAADTLAELSTELSVLREKIESRDA